MIDKELNLERYSTLEWIRRNKIKNEMGKPIEFSHHFFMLKPYTDTSAIQVYRKGSQIGASLMQTIKTLHAARFHGINQIYTLPTDTDRNSFVKTKVNPVIQNNSCIGAGMPWKMKDSIEDKQIGQSWIFFRGTWTERTAIMLTAQRNMHDEYDHSKLQVVDQYETRQGAQAESDIQYFSTPTIPDFGIDALWTKSDQKHWRFECPHCRHGQYMTWEENVDIEQVAYVCAGCKGVITTDDIAKGRWEQRYPKREISGYWINQLMCPWIKPKRIIEARNKYEERGELDIFYNFNLGMPYVSSDQQIPSTYFIRNIRELADIDLKGGNVMGIDTGGAKGNHAVIRNRSGVFWVGKFLDSYVSLPGDASCEYCGRPIIRTHKCGCRWEQIADFISRDKGFDIETIVIDGLPYTQEALTLARKFPYRVFLAVFNDKLDDMTIIQYEDQRRAKEARRRPLEEQARVQIARTRIIDHFVSRLRKQKIPHCVPIDSDGFQELLKHAGNMFARNIEGKFGQTRREWANTGAIDLMMAEIYAEVALMREGVDD